MPLSLGLIINRFESTVSVTVVMFSLPLSSRQNPLTLSVTQ